MEKLVLETYFLVEHFYSVFCLSSRLTNIFLLDMVQCAFCFSLFLSRISLSFPLIVTFGATIVVGGQKSESTYTYNSIQRSHSIKVYPATSEVKKHIHKPYNLRDIEHIQNTATLETRSSTLAASGCMYMYELIIGFQ